MVGKKHKDIYITSVTLGLCTD